MTLSKRHAHEIEETTVFVSCPPEHGLEGTPGDDQLAYAIALCKPVIVWMPTGDRPIPKRLAGYPHDVVRTDAELMSALTPHLGEPGGTVRIDDGGYGEHAEVLAS